VDRLRAAADQDNDFAVDLTRARVESFPPYEEEEKDLESDQPWSDYEGRYRSNLDADPVMHRVGTDRNITPTTPQMPGNSRPARAAAIPWADSGKRNAGRIDDPGFHDPGFDNPGFDNPGFDNPGLDNPGLEDSGAFTEGGFAAGTDSVEISSGAMGMGPRWDTFQNRLRERLKEVIRSGATAESAERYPKASQLAGICFARPRLRSWLFDWTSRILFFFSCYAAQNL